MATMPRAARRTAACGLISVCVLLSLLLLTALENAAYAWTSHRDAYPSSRGKLPPIEVGDCRLMLRLGKPTGIGDLPFLAAELMRQLQDLSATEVFEVGHLNQGELTGGTFVGFDVTVDIIKDKCQTDPPPADLSIVYNRTDGSTWRDAVSAEFQLQGTEGDDVYLYTFSFIAANEQRVAAKDNVPEPLQSTTYAPPTLETLTETDDEITLAGFNFIDDDATLINWGGISITGDALTIDAAADEISFAVPSGVSGNISVSVTTAGGTSNALGFGYPGDADIVAKTQKYIAERLTARAQRIVSEEDSDMIKRRLTVGNTANVDGSGPIDQMRLSFESGLSAGDFVPNVSVWTRGTMARAHTATDDMDVWLVYAGIDYRLNDDTVIGLLAQGDWVVEDNGKTSFEGTGWLAGPYVGLRLHDNLILDGRIAWGRSINDVNAIGYYTDRFRTTRWLGRAQLSGDFHAGNVAIAPFVQTVYFAETQDGYTDTPGNWIPAQTIKLGHLRFGPEVRADFDIGGGLVMSPHGSISGIWQFEQSGDGANPSGVGPGGDDLRARAEAGIGLSGRSGWSIGVQSFYELTAGMTAGTATVTATLDGTLLVNQAEVRLVLALLSADAGEDQNVDAGADVQLDGAVTGASSYAWQQVTGDGSHDALTNGDCHLVDGTDGWALNETFTAPSPSTDCDIYLRLTAIDDVNPNAVDWVKISVDAALSADAGEDQIVNAGAEVKLDGSVTGATSFAWDQVAGDGNNVAVTSGDCHVNGGTDNWALKETFNAPILTSNCDIHLRLTAQDDVNPDAVDWVKIAVRAVSIDVTIVAPEEADRLEPFSVAVEFGEAVCGFDAKDVIFSGAKLSNFSEVCTDIDDQDAYESEYSFSLTPAGNGDITIQVRENAARNFVGNGNSASAMVTVAVMDVVAETQRYIAEKITARAQRILGSEGTDMIRSRLLQPSGGSERPGTFSITGVLDNLDIKFQTSFRSLYSYYSRSDQLATRRLGLQGDPTGDGAPDASAEYTYGFDIWTKATYDRTHNDSSTMDVWLIYTGIDYQFDERFVVGFLGQTDSTDETDSDDGTSFGGTGWMVGPYTAVRLHENLIFDGRLAWGRSVNDVNAIGYYTDEFDTTRWLGRAQFSGTFEMQNVALTPFIQMVYFEERQKSYTDTPGNFIPAQKISIGRLRFGPEISGSLVSESGVRLSPFGSVSGIWDFAQTDHKFSGGTARTDEDFRARADGGFRLTTLRGWSVNFQGFYEIGGTGGAKSWGGSILLRIPLQGL